MTKITHSAPCVKVKKSPDNSAILILASTDLQEAHVTGGVVQLTLGVICVVACQSALRRSLVLPDMPGDSHLSISDLVSRPPNSPDHPSRASVRSRQLRVAGTDFEHQFAPFTVTPLELHLNGKT